MPDVVLEKVEVFGKYLKIESRGERTNVEYIRISTITSISSEYMSGCGYHINIDVNPGQNAYSRHVSVDNRTQDVFEVMEQLVAKISENG